MDLGPKPAPVRRGKAMSIVDTTYREFLTLLSKKQHREYVVIGQFIA